MEFQFFITGDEKRFCLQNRIFRTETFSESFCPPVIDFRQWRDGEDEVGDLDTWYWVLVKENYDETTPSSPDMSLRNWTPREDIHFSPIDTKDTRTPGGEDPE